MLWIYFYVYIWLEIKWKYLKSKNRRKNTCITQKKETIMIYIYTLML